MQAQQEQLADDIGDGEKLKVEIGQLLHKPHADIDHQYRREQEQEPYVPFLINAKAADQ